MCTLTSKEWSIFRGHTSVFHPPPPLKVKQPFEFGIHTCYSLTFNWKNCCLKCQVLYSKNIPFEIFCVFCSRSSKATLPFPLLLLYFQSRKCRYSKSRGKSSTRHVFMALALLTMCDFLDFGLTFFSIIVYSGSCTITSKAKINVY